MLERLSNVFDIAQALINQYGLERSKLGKIWGDYLGFAYVDPNASIVSEEYINKLGFDFVKKNKVLPCFRKLGKTH